MRPTARIELEPRAGGTLVILRGAAALALLWGAAVVLLYLHLLGKGPFATPPERHLRAMKERDTAPTVVDTMSIARFAALPHGLSFARYAAIERQGVEVEGYVWSIEVEPDGDFHIHLTPRPGVLHYIITELTPRWRHGSSWTYDQLVAVLRPTHGGVTRWAQGPRRVRFSGWLLYDYPHDRHGFHDPHGQPFTPGWEVHPVTRIELWDDSLGRFVEYPS